MERNTDSDKVILECNKEGIVEKLFLDSGSLFKDMELPVSLHSLVSPSSVEVLESFWTSIQNKSMVENTVLSLNYNDKDLTYLFSGYLLNDKVLLCGNTEVTSTDKTLEEIIMINNEQANQIRLFEKKVENNLKEGDTQKINEELLNDFSALNNELINNKRELVSKNQKIELLNEELKEANENMRMFTYSVSHDLKQPVGMLKGLLTLIHKSHLESLDQKGQKFINMALEGSNRLSKMMADLLEYHQSSNLDISETVDLNSVLQDVKYILQEEIKLKNVQISSEDLPTIKGSSIACRQIFQNLFSNAIKFVPEERTPTITIKVEEADTYYTFSVKDNGIGIAESKKQEVFSLFKRLNSPQQFEGTGMGLAMVKKSIERMGGEIWLESEEGEGTTFFFTLSKSFEF